MRGFVLALGFATFSLAAPQAMAGGGHHHHHHGSHNDFVPFAIGAVTGIVIGQAISRPVYASPPPPPPVVEYRYYNPPPPPPVIRPYYYNRPPGHYYHHYYRPRAY